MIVSFRTAGGSRYHIDHTNNQWIQESPIIRSGPLYNKPQVIRNKKVVIWTVDADERIRVIQTAPVVEREVNLEAASHTSSVPGEHEAVCSSSVVHGNDTPTVVAALEGT